LGIEHGPAGIFVEAIDRSVKEKETFPGTYRCLDEIFPLIEKNSQDFVLKWSDIVVRDSKKIYHN